MHKFLIIIFISVSLYGDFSAYIPTTTITNYDINMTLDVSGELDITEKIEVLPRNLDKGFKVDNPLIWLDIPTMIKSKSAIRFIDSEPYDFSVLLNDKPVYWEKRIFYENAPQKQIKIRLSANYIMDLLSDDEKESIIDTPKQYVYTLKYKVKKTVIEDATKGFEAIEWKMLKNSSHIAVKHSKVNIFFPSTLTKEHIENFDMTYTAKNQNKQTFVWKNSQHFYAEIDNLRNNNLIFRITFPQGSLQQSAKDNFNMVLDAESEKKDTLAYRWDTFLLYWQFPFFILYFIFLYYYARSYGSFGALGPIVVRYKPADKMSLLQSATIIDKSADNSELPAAIIELAGLGYIEIIDKGWGKSAYLKQIRKDTTPLTEDQRYLLKRVLFSGRDVYYLPKNKSDLYHKLEILNNKLHNWMLDEGYIYANFKKIRKMFLIKALVTSIPILIFSLYVTKELYGERLMIGAIAGIYFITGIIAVILIKESFARALPFLVAIYIIIGIPFITSGASYLTLLSNPILVMPFIYAFIWFFYKKIDIYTGKGLKAYQHLLGYKKFVKRTEVSKLEYMSKEHPKGIETSLAYAILFKMISYPSLSSYKRDAEKSKIINNYKPRISYWGILEIRNNISIEMFIFWLTGIMLFFILKAYETF